MKLGKKKQGMIHVFVVDDKKDIDKISNIISNIQHKGFQVPNLYISHSIAELELVLERLSNIEKKY